jgi:hypothetical protein
MNEKRYIVRRDANEKKKNYTPLQTGQQLGKAAAKNAINTPSRLQR